MLKNPTQLDLTGNRILVKEAKDIDNVTNEGIILDTKAPESPFSYSEVVRVGPDVKNVVVGDIICHILRGGTLLRVGKVHYSLISEPEIAAIVHLEERPEII